MAAVTYCLNLYQTTDPQHVSLVVTLARDYVFPDSRVYSSKRLLIETPPALELVLLPRSES